MRDISGSMMQIFEAVKSATNVDIPNLLQTISEGGLVGKKVSEQAENQSGENETKSV